jgi:hypothetical protein
MVDVMAEAARRAEQIRDQAHRALDELLGRSPKRGVGTWATAGGVGFVAGAVAVVVAAISSAYWYVTKRQDG